MMPPASKLDPRRQSNRFRFEKIHKKGHEEHESMSRLPLVARNLAIAATAFLVLVSATSASSLLSFRLTNQGGQSIGRIDLSVQPPGAVVPPVSPTDPSATGSPLTILKTSSGFDQSQFAVALGSKPDAQILRLLFGQTQTVDAAGNVTFNATLGSDGQPIGLFNPGAVLDFSLAVDPDLMASMRLELPQGASGIVLQTWPVQDTGSSPNPSTQGQNPSPNPAANQVPEPATCALWSIVIVALAMSNRHRRR